MKKRKMEKSTLRDIPNNLLPELFEYLPLNLIRECGLTCLEWQNEFQEDHLWARLYSDRVTRISYYEDDYMALYRDVLNVGKLAYPSISSICTIEMETYISNHFRYYPNTCYGAVVLKYDFIRYAPEEVKTNRKFVLQLRTIHISDFPEFRNDKEIVCKAIACNPYQINNINEKLQLDEDVIRIYLEKINKSYLLTHFLTIPNRMRSNYNFVLKAVHKNGNFLKCSARGFKKNETIVKAAITESVDSLRFASHSLKMKKNFGLAAVSINGHAIHHLSEELQYDPEIVNAAISTTPDLFCCYVPLLQDKIKRWKEILSQKKSQK